MVVLTLLPKIDILRLTKRHHKKEPPSSLLISLLHLTSTTQSRKLMPSPRSTRHYVPSVCAQVPPENSYSLRIGTKILRVILPSQHPFKSENRIKTSQKKVFFKEKNNTLI